MEGFIEIPGAGELKTGQMKAYKAGNKEILLARLGNDYYAADKYCPHMGGTLSDGKLDGTIVTCPRHHSRFDLKDGRVVRWTDWSGFKLALAKMFKAPRPLQVYPTKVEEGRVYVNTGAAYS